MKNTKKAGKAVAIILVIIFIILGGLIAIINSGNPLTGAAVTEYPVKSGSGEQIGTYAVVKLSNKQFEKLTPEYYAEYAKGTVDGSGYNWYTVANKNGKGAVWNGSDITTLTVGTIDADYCITETENVYTLSSGEYVAAE